MTRPIAAVLNSAHTVGSASLGSGLHIRSPPDRPSRGGGQGRAADCRRQRHYALLLFEIGQSGFKSAAQCLVLMPQVLGIECGVSTGPATGLNDCSGGIGYAGLIRFGGEHALGSDYGCRVMHDPPAIAPRPNTSASGCRYVNGSAYVSGQQLRSPLTGKRFAFLMYPKRLGEFPKCSGGLFVAAILRRHHPTQSSNRASACCSTVRVALSCLSGG